MSIRSNPGPRAGSYSRLLLDALAAAPKGTLSVQRAQQVMPAEYRTARRFEQAALTPLQDTYRMALQIGNAISITPAGWAYLLHQRAADAPPTQTHVGQVALPRTAPAFKPLRLSRLLQGQSVRDGMNEYRTAPSLMGGERVAFRGGVK